LDIFHLYYLSVLAAKWEDLLKIVNRLRNGTSEYKPVIMKRKREERREQLLIEGILLSVSQIVYRV
jgi:hypothetical protein